MQRLSRDVVKNKIAYTWYAYPLVFCVSLLCWIWGFRAYHQPKDFEKIVMFIAEDVKDISFTKDIKNKYNEDKLRDIELHFCEPTRNVFSTKLDLYLNVADIVVFPEKLLDSLIKAEASFDFINEYFHSFSNDIKTKYNLADKNYYQIEDNNKKYWDIAVKIKDSASKTWLDSYINFKENESYYALITKASKNSGSLREPNYTYDNSLTILNYLDGSAL